MPEAALQTTKPKLTIVDGAAAIFALLVPIGFSTAFTAPFSTPKAALVLLALPFLLLLGRSALRAHRVPALLGLCFLAAASAATALAGQPDLAFFGAYGHGVGLLFFGALVAMWMIGLHASDRGVSLIERALFAAVLVNVAFALVQPLVDLSPYGLGLLQSRTPGVMGNPVHLAALFLGAFAFAFQRAASGQWPNTVGTGLIAAGIQLSGSRAALVGSVALAVAFLVRHRSRKVAALIVATGLGLAVGQGINAAGHGVSGTTRVDEGLGGESTAARFATWSDAVDAIAERPVFGHGPGRYLAATAPHRSLELAKFGPERYFRDAHNILVELATTVGLSGAMLFASWVGFAARGARGPLLYFAGGVLAIHLVQPVYVGTTPLALLALGAATRPRVDASSVRTPDLVAASAAGVAAMACAAALVRGEAGLQQADLAYSPVQARDAMSYLPFWPEPRAFTARMEVSLSITERNEDRFDAALELYREAVAADPQDPRRWNELGGAYLGAGQHLDALAAYRSAVAVNPLSYGGLTGIARSALELNDPDTAAEAVDRAARIIGEDHPTLQNLRRRIEEAKRAGP